MSDHPQTRTYALDGTRFQVSCSAAMAGYLDSRFRLLPADERCTQTVFVDFDAVSDPGSHKIARPPGDGRSFYDIRRGEACYFEDADVVYLRIGDGVQALYEPRLNHITISSVESRPKNLFNASHLVLTILLIEVLKRRSRYSLHAAAFSENDRAILIAGTSGAGKSTLSIALVRAGFGYLTDDMVFLGRSADGMVVRGLAEDIDVSDQTIAFFPELNDLLRFPRADGYPKRQVRVEEMYGARVVRESRPAAIVFPHISGNPASTITPVDSDEALLEIAPNALRTQACACQSHLAALVDLVKQTKSYRLDAGRDFDRIPDIFREILEREAVSVHV